MEGAVGEGAFEHRLALRCAAGRGGANAYDGSGVDAAARSVSHPITVRRLFPIRPRTRHFGYPERREVLRSAFALSELVPFLRR